MVVGPTGRVTKQHTDKSLGVVGMLLLFALLPRRQTLHPSQYSTCRSLSTNKNVLVTLRSPTSPRGGAVIRGAGERSSDFLFFLVSALSCLSLFALRAWCCFPAEIVVAPIVVGVRRLLPVLRRLPLLAPCFLVCSFPRLAVCLAKPTLSEARVSFWHSLAGRSIPSTVKKKHPANGALVEGALLLLRVMVRGRLLYNDSLSFSTQAHFSISSPPFCLLFSLGIVIALFWSFFFLSL